MEIRRRTASVTAVPRSALIFGIFAIAWAQSNFCSFQQKRFGFHRTQTTMSLLDLQDVSLAFGGPALLSHADFSIERGEIGRAHV